MDLSMKIFMLFRIYGIVGDSFDIRIIFTIIVTLIELLIIGNVIVLLIYM